MASSAKAAGRLAGLVYLGVVLTGIFCLAFAPSLLIVDGDGAATADAIARNGGVFWASIVAGLAMSALYLALPVALARFLNAYGKIAARLMIAFVAASIPFMLIAIAELVGVAGLSSAESPAPEAVTARLDAHDRWMGIASIFWGLWLAPLGWLILKSGAIPRILGALLIAGCAGYLANYFGPRFFEGYNDLPFRNLISKPGTIGEIGTCLWLLVMGARERAAP